MPESAIIIFARALEAGHVKTRLIPSLGADQALNVYTRILDHTLAAAKATGLPVVLYGTADHPSLRARARGTQVSLRIQRGADLGERMTRALMEQHNQGYRRLLLVGSDCPVLDVSYLRGALKQLEATDFVLGPAEDGGYVLFGSGAPGCLQADTLAGARFGTDRALEDTQAALSRLGRVVQLDTLWDLDEYPDWQRARAEGVLD